MQDMIRVLRLLGKEEEENLIKHVISFKYVFNYSQ